MRNGQVSRQQQLHDLVVSAADSSRQGRRGLCIADLHGTPLPRRAMMVKNGVNVLVNVENHRKVHVRSCGRRTPDC